MFPPSGLQTRAPVAGPALVLLAGLLALQLVAGDGGHQQTVGVQRVLTKRQASTSATATAMAQAAAAPGGPSRTVSADASSNPRVGQGAPQGPANRQKQQPRPATPDSDGELVDEQRQPLATRPGAASDDSKRRRPNRKQFRKQQNHDDYEDDDENCYDYDDDRDFDIYRPLGHMQRMMGSMFETMQGLSSDAFRSGRQAFRGAGRSGGTGASASSFANSDGFSRSSSLVNENGRTRGLVTETRNGRTQTRRIGDQPDDDEDLE